jgi:hypothetical protein
MRLALLTKQRIAPPLHFSRIEVLFPCEKYPDMPERITQACRIRAIEHFCGRLDLLCAGLDRTPEDSLIVIDKDVKARARSTKGSWLTIALVVWISDHQYGATDGDFSVKDLSIGMSDPKQLDSSECLFVEVDSARSTIDIDMGDKRI